MEAREVRNGLEHAEGHSDAVLNDKNQASLPVFGQGGSSQIGHPSAGISCKSEAIGRIFKQDKWHRKRREFA